MLALASKPRSTPRSATPPAPAPPRNGSAAAIPLHRAAVGTLHARTADASPDADARGGGAPGAVHQVLRSPGAPLPVEARGEMEARFGRDFAGVRIHTDARAAESARAVDAAAYTVGRDIVFAAGRYDVASTDGRRLLAHELAHVAQQPDAAAGGALQVAPPHAPEEHEADAASRSVVAGAAPPVLSPARGGAGVARAHAWIYRQPPATKTKYPAVVDITVTTATVLSGTLTSTAKVRVASAAEEAEARQIIGDVHMQYGITLDTKKGADTVRSKVQGDPDDVQSMADSLQNKPKTKLKDGIAATEWDLAQLRALKEALGYFGPAAGAAARMMGRTGLSGYTFSRANTGLNEANDARDPNVLGEHFGAEKNITLYDAAGAGNTGLKDKSKAVTGTFVHELAHALMGGGSAFVTGLTPPFWKDLKTKTGTAGAEAPVTSYGEKNAEEDVAEATKFYFLERATLLAKCPQRFRIIDAKVKSWAPPTPGPGPTP